MERKLKIALCILIVILILAIAVLGIYSKNIYTYENILPDYLLSTEFEGKRISYFTVDSSSEEVIYDSEGNEVDEIPEGEDESNYTTETVYANSEELLTADNYKLVKEIFEGRLSELGVEEYTVRLDETTGEIVVELEDDTTTDTMLEYLLCTGDFSITDSEDGTVLLDKSDVSSASVVYASTDSSTVTVYLDIKFNSEGAKKLEEISNEYIVIEDDETEEEEETIADDETEDTTEETETTETEEETTDETTEETEEEEEEEQKMITVTLEGTEFLTTYFGETISSGELTISIGSATTSDEVYDYITQGQVYAMLINNEEMPISYTLTATEYMPSSLGDNTIYIILGLLALVTVAIIVYLIIRYKVDGLLSSIAFIAGIGILSLLIRFTSTTISIGTIAAVFILFMINLYFVNKILKNIKEDATYENVKKQTLQVYLENIEAIIVFLIIAVVFTFMSELDIFSIGMALFYGIISIAIGNLVFMRIMLMAKYDKE